jgi:DNA-binding CsgD family transcriptional regulator
MATPRESARGVTSTVEAGADNHSSRTSRALELRAAELEELKRQGGGLLDTGELAERAGCSRATVNRHAAELEAMRATGDCWHGKNGTLLFRSAAVDQLRAILAERRRDKELARGRQKGLPRMLEARAAELEQLKRQNGRVLDARQVAELAGCTPATVDRHAAELDAVRAGGDGWNAAHGTWLFPPSAPEQLRAILAEGKACNAAALALARSEGRTAPPRTGVEKPCPCGCGGTTYLSPSRTTRPGYLSRRHWGRDRWWRRHLVHEKLLHGGKMRQEWLGRWAPKGGRRRNDARPDWHDVLETIREKYDETHASERDLERMTGESRRTIRIALGRPVGRS